MADFPIKKDININGAVNSYVYPQHEKADGSFVVTGEKNPLPVADYGMTSGGVWIPKRVSDDGAAHTQVTGSKVKLIKEFKSPVVATFNFFGENHTTGASGLIRLNIQKYDEVFFWVENNTSSAFSVRLYMGDTSAQGGSSANREYFVLDEEGGQVSVPAGTNAWFSLKEYPKDEAVNILKKSPFTHFGVRLLLNNAPSEGSEIALKIYGRG